MDGADVATSCLAFQNVGRATENVQKGNVGLKA